MCPSLFVSLIHVIFSASFRHFILTQFYLNPTAFGCNRAQLVVEDISDDGIIQFGVVDGKATSSNMNVIMKTCEEASDSGIGCGEVKWESGQVYQDRDVNYLPARNDLGGKKKEACRGFNFEMTLDTSDNLVIGKLSVQLDEDLETEDMWGSDTQTHTNDVIIGVHLHLGASDEDGPPSVVFCGSSNEYPLPSSDIICEDAM
jgi:hypothetical protein